MDKKEIQPFENLFTEGDETSIECQKNWYYLLMEGKTVSTMMVAAKCTDRMGELTLFERYKISDFNDKDSVPDKQLCKYVQAFAKVRPRLVATMEKYAPNTLHETRRSHEKCYEYIGKDRNPLLFMELKSVIKSLSAFSEFCEDSAGFFPKSWFNYFFHNTKELFNTNRKRQDGLTLMNVSIDRKINNIELLPIIYEMIKNRKIIEFDYTPQYGTDVQHKVLHPHFLHEFNGRWHLLGFEKDAERFPSIFAMDRIVKESGIKESICGEEYIAPENGFYNKYFNNIIGVTHGIMDNEHKTPERWEDSIPKKIVIRVYTKYMFGLTDSKPIHHSQHRISDYDEDKGYGEFELFVEMNNEFIGRILEKGPHLEIISPIECRNVFKQRISRMASNYGII